MTLDASSEVPCSWRGDPRHWLLASLKRSRTPPEGTAPPRLLLFPARPRGTGEDAPSLIRVGVARIETGRTPTRRWGPPHTWVEWGAWGGVFRRRYRLLLHDFLLRAPLTRVSMIWVTWVYSWADKWAGLAN